MQIIDLFIHRNEGKLWNDSSNSCFEVDLIIASASFLGNIKAFMRFYKSLYMSHRLLFKTHSCVLAYMNIKSDYDSRTAN